MKKIHLVLILTFIAGFLAAQNWTVNLPQGKAESGDLTFYEIQKAFNDYWEPYNIEENGYYTENGEKKKAVGWKQFRRWEYYWADRIVKETGQFPKTSTPEEMENYKLTNPDPKSVSGNWTSLGPSATSGGYAGLGRINCVGFVSGDNNTIYAGAASGGIWKSTNAGTSWTPLGDNNPVLGVSDIVVVPGSNPHIIYIATGDKNGGALWSLGGGQNNDNNSIGILKSTDGGVTWNTTGLSFTPSQQRTVNRLLLHPTNNNILYAATSVGVYKTTNAGTSWSLITSNVYADMEFNPGTPATIYGSNYNGDIYRSTNDGSTWTVTLNTAHARTEIAVTAHNSAVVYAVVANTSNGLAGIYKSTDSGASFSQVFSGSTTNMLNWDCNSTASGGQAWYDLCIAADPTNSNNVFVGGVNTWRSTNGGTSWSINNHWYGGCSVPSVHADKHFLGYQNGTSTLWEGNDGGVYRTTNNGSSWTHRGSGLVTSQIYRLGVAQSVSNETIIGLQDNGTKAFLSGSWYDVLGGDGFECFFDYTNQNTIYGSLYYGDLRRSTNHGSSWSAITSGLSGSAYWCTPFVIDPNVNTTLYVGFQDVFRSTNQGSSWTKISTWNGITLRSLAVAPSNSGYIYAATPSILNRTTNGGSTWTNITGTLPVGSNNITYVSVKHNDPNTVWVSMGNYNSSKVYQTTNGGSTWTNISTGLPSIPVMCVIQNKQNTTVNELYAGTDAGVYVKIGSANWIPFSTGLPNVVVTELEIYYAADPANSRIRAATYGRGLWQSDLYTIAAPPVADFSANNTTPTVGETVTFTDLSSNSPTSWTWSFNPSTISYTGGTGSTSQSPEVQFNELGYYTVQLMATNALGSDSEAKSNYINVVPCTYCASSSSTFDEEWISNVTFNTINNSTGGTAGYNDYTSISTDLNPGNSYNISVSIGSTGNWAEYCYVFIDWNQDCNFAGSGEVYNLGTITGSGTLSQVITIPVTATPGPTRMRVSVKYNGAPGACENFQYGEVEDYSVNILAEDIALELKAYLEGPFNGSGMTPYLGSLIPLTQPYNISPWNYTGAENAGSVPANLVDWVLVELRDAPSSAAAIGATMVDRQAAFLLTDGSVVGLDGSSNLTFPNSITQQLYVVIWHRNHLGVMSANAVTPSGGGIYTYDFTTGSATVHGGANGHKQLTTDVWGMISGDGNRDGTVGMGDKSTLWESEAGTEGYIYSDYNLDRQSNNIDKDDFWMPNLGKGSQVPN